MRGRVSRAHAVQLIAYLGHAQLVLHLLHRVAHGRQMRPDVEQLATVFDGGNLRWNRFCLAHTATCNALLDMEVCRPACPRTRYICPQKIHRETHLLVALGLDFL